MTLLPLGEGASKVTTSLTIGLPLESVRVAVTDAGFGSPVPGWALMAPGFDTETLAVGPEALNSALVWATTAAAPAAAAVRAAGTRWVAPGVGDAGARCW